MAIIPQSLKNSLYHFPKALLAILIYQYPARHLKVIGVTGSDGKTTTTHLIYHILNSLGIKVCLVSTVSAKIGENETDTGFHVTSPDPFLLQKLFREIVDKGFTHVVLEATSHGLDQHRLLGTNISIAVLTNITHEHLDYHRTYGNYVQAKSKLFQGPRWAVLNKDDKSFKLIRAYIPRSVNILTYGLGGNAALRAGKIIVSPDSSTFELQWKNSRQTVNLPLPGRYNIQNALGAIGAVISLGIKPKEILNTLATFTHVPGRMNQVHKNPKVFIDFAHTPNALEQVLTFLKTQLLPNSRLIVVFGCAGERDFTKRPMMGKISARLADITIFTTEDPRHEKVANIIDAMISGAKKTKARLLTKNVNLTDLKRHIYIQEPNRQEAINLAVKLARPQDIIVVTGKGHEKSMNYGAGEVPWSDFDAVNSALSANG